MQQIERIAHGLVALDGITSTAGIDQIEIVELSSGIERLRLEMVEIEFARDLPPRFTFQAIDATKVKLVAKPRAVAFVMKLSSSCFENLRIQSFACSEIEARRDSNSLSGGSLLSIRSLLRKNRVRERLKCSQRGLSIVQQSHGVRVA